MKISDSILSGYSTLRKPAVPAAEINSGALAPASRTSAPTVAPSIASTGRFSEALWLSVASEEDGAPQQPLSGIEQDFMEWSQMSLAEKIRAQILDAKGLTEGDLAALPADEREAIEAEIREAILEQMGGLDGDAKTEEEVTPVSVSL